MNKQKNKNIYEAIILSAGFGVRLRPLTFKTPKPLIKINKEPIIFYILEELRINNILKCFINVHYLPNKIIKYLKQYSNIHKSMQIIIIREKFILDTGGAVKNIAKKYTKNPLIVINGDSIIISKKNKSPLQQLIKNFDINVMNFLLLLDNNKNSIGYNGKGDFKFIKKNKLPSIIERSSKHNIAYTGWQIVNPKSVLNIKNKKFSLNICYDDAIKNKLLWGILNKEKWLHIGTYESLTKAKTWMQINK